MKHGSCIILFVLNIKQDHVKGKGVHEPKVQMAGAYTRLLSPPSPPPPDQDGMLVHQREVCRRYPFIHRGKDRDKVKWRSLSKETTRGARLNGSRTSRSWVRGINRSATYAYTRRIIKIYSYSIHKTLPSCRLRLRPYICRLCNALIW